MPTKYTAEQPNDNHYRSMPRETMFVLATDYAALEAQRDELKRRLATIIHEMSNLALRNKRDKLIVAIAEGRDNG